MIHTIIGNILRMYYLFEILSVIGVVRIVISPATVFIGESVIFISLLLRLVFIILIIVLMGSGWVLPSASVAMRVVDIVSSLIVKP